MTEVIEQSESSDAWAGFDALVYFLKKVTEVVMQTAKILSDLYISIISMSSNKRVVHLMKYGKKNRTRKKNMHRLHKNFLIFLKRHKEKGENYEDN